jgi:hypothetical protein
MGENREWATEQDKRAPEPAVRLRSVVGRSAVVVLVALCAAVVPVVLGMAVPEMALGHGVSGRGAAVVPVVLGVAVASGVLGAVVLCVVMSTQWSCVYTVLCTYIYDEFMKTRHDDL